MQVAYMFLNFPPDSLPIVTGADERLASSYGNNEYHDGVLKIVRQKIIIVIIINFSSVYEFD